MDYSIGLPRGPHLAGWIPFALTCDGLTEQRLGLLDAEIECLLCSITTFFQFCNARIEVRETPEQHTG